MPILMFVVVVILGILGYFYIKNPKIQKPGEVQAKSIAEVSITKDGFVPETLSVVLGQQATFVNDDKTAHRVIPDPSFATDSLPEFDSEDLEPSDSFIYSFEKKGTFTITDSLNSSKYKVTVIVE